jgi:S1-C subfamily serine protease
MMTEMTEPEAIDEPQAQGAPPAPVAPPRSVERGASFGVTIAAAIVVAIVLGAMAGGLAGYWGARIGLLGASGGRTIINAPDKITVVPDKTSEPVVAASVAAVPSVVNIDVTTGIRKKGAKDLPSSHPDVPATGNGSGVAYKAAPDGGTYILTNNHVVEDASQITVRSPGGNRWNAKLVGRDPDTDIAVLEIGGKLPPIHLADSSKVLVGEYVVAIGSPFGLEHSVTFGVVSAIGRSLPDFGSGATGTYPLVDVIQTDAAINPGNSGGALVDRSGALVGINTAIYGGDGRNAGIGFAIPSNTAARIADQLISKGKVNHPFLGIVGVTVGAEQADARKLGVDEGALVLEFSPGSTAQKAGVRVGDVVVSVNGDPVRSMDDLILLVRRNAVGDKVELGLVRAGKRLTVTAEVGQKPENLQVAPSQTATP